MEFPIPISIKKDSGSIVARLQVNETQEYFDGHFVGAPVLAGVVQIGLVIRLMEEHLGHRLVFKGFKSVKFTGLIQPPADIELTLDFIRERNFVKYRIDMDKEKCSSGIILVELGEPTN